MDKSKTLENELYVAYIAGRTLLKEIKTSSVKKKISFFRHKFGVNQHDKYYTNNNHWV